MATLTIDIPDAVVNRCLNAVAATTGWTSTNGFTKAQWAKKVVATYLKNIVTQYEVRQAIETQEQSSHSELNIT